MAKDNGKFQQVMLNHLENHFADAHMPYPYPDNFIRNYFNLISLFCSLRFDLTSINASFFSDTWPKAQMGFICSE